MLGTHVQVFSLNPSIRQSFVLPPIAMLLANYASDSDSESDSRSAPRPGPSRAPQTIAAKPSAPAKRKAGPVRITLDLPKASTPLHPDDDDEDNGASAASNDSPPKLATAQGLKGGAGSSSLVGMLPAPKRKVVSKDGLKVNMGMARPAKRVQVPVPVGMEGVAVAVAVGDDGDEVEEAGGVGKKSKKDSIDLFGLCAFCIVPLAKLIPSHPLRQEGVHPPRSAAPVHLLRPRHRRLRPPASNAPRSLSGILPPPLWILGSVRPRVLPHVLPLDLA